MCEDLYHCVNHQMIGIVDVVVDDFDTAENLQYLSNNIIYFLFKSLIDKSI